MTLYYLGQCHELHGFNCQACVCSNLSFMYFGIISPGSTNDIIPYPMAVGLRGTGMYCVADAAYTLIGLDWRDPAYSAFYFPMSQLWICNEMTFGLLEHSQNSFFSQIHKSQVRKM